MSAYTNQVTGDNRVAKNWGGSIDMTGMPDWATPLVAQNVLYVFVIRCNVNRCSERFRVFS